MELLPLVPRSWQEQRRWPSLVRSAVLAVLIPTLVLGTWYRVQSYLVARERSLDPDPKGFYKLAREMGHPYESGYREPLQILLVKGSLALFGDRPSSVLIPTLVVSVLLIPVTFLFGRAVFSLPVGLGGAVLVGFNHHLIWSAARGYRMELFSVLILLYVYILLVARGWRPWRRLLLAGVVGGLLLLVRITAVTVLVPALALWVWRERKLGGQWGKLVAWAALSLAIGLGLVAPYLVECERVYGRPLYAIDIHAQWWSDAEAGDNWAERMATPIEEQSTMSVLDYLFSPGHVGRTVIRSLRGYWLAVRMLPWYAGSWRFVMSFALAGVAMTVVRRERYLLWVAFWTFLPFAVVMPIGGEVRFFMWLYPVYALWVVVGLYPFGFGVLHHLRGAAGRRGPRPLEENQRALGPAP